MLERVRFRDYDRGVDVEALTDGYAYDEYSCVHLLSVAGHDSNVKAITSAVATGRTVEIMTDPVTETWGSYGQKFRTLTTKLPSGLLHQVVAGEGFFRLPDRPRSLLYVEGEDPAGVVYEAVRTACPVPLIPEWAEWLYGTLRREGHVQELYGTRKVLKINVGEKVLDSLVSEAVGNGEISF